MPMHLILTIIMVGLAATVLTDLLPLQPIFKRLIIAVAVIWLIFVIFGTFGGGANVGG
jgi:hypothetical protein